MEARKSIVVLLVIISLTAFRWPPERAFAYDDQTAHPALTQEMVKFYDAKYPNNKLAMPDAELIIQGSIDEDGEARFFHHFYDPVHKRGLKGTWSSSQEWVRDDAGQTKIENDGKLQARQPLSKQVDAVSNYSWNRGVYDYVHGDKRHALLALGHALHLLEDASVPDHTRDDAHDPYIGKESPYEHYTTRYTRRTITTAGDLLRENTEPIELGSPEEYIRDLARYTNGNFFSRDTIFLSYFPNPKEIERKDVKLNDGLLHTFVYGREGLLAEVDKPTLRKKKASTDVYILDDVDSLILTSYFSHLSREAVRRGAGMINLFFQDVEKERKTGKLDEYYHPKSGLEKFLDSIKGIQNAASVFSVYTVSPNSGVRLLNKEESDSSAVVTKVAEVKSLDEARAVARESGVTFPATVIVKTGDSDLATRARIAEILARAAKTADGFKILADELAKKEKSKTIDAKKQETTSPLVLDLESTTTLKILRSMQIFGGGGGNVIPYPTQTSEPNEEPPPAQEEEVTAPLAPLITSPAPLSQIFATTSITFTGTAQASTTLRATFNSTSSTTPVNETGNWTLPLVLTEGTTTVSFVITDSNGSTSSSTDATIEIALPDPLPPLLTPTLSCNSSLATLACFFYTSEGTMPVGFSWSSSGEGATYTLKEGDTTLQTTTSLLATSTLPTGDHTLTLIATRESETATSSPLTISLTTSLPIQLSELMWGGNLDLPNDEWIELKNQTSHTLLMSRFNLDMKADAYSSAIATLPLSGTSAPNSYFLLERVDDQNIADVTADMVYTGFELPDLGVLLNLYLDETLIESTPPLLHIPKSDDDMATECPNKSSSVSQVTNWCAGYTVDGISMERRSFVLPADGQNMTWYENGGDGYRSGTDRNGDTIFGTPRAPYIPHTGGPYQI